MNERDNVIGHKIKVEQINRNIIIIPTPSAKILYLHKSVSSNYTKL